MRAIAVVLLVALALLPCVALAKVKAVAAPKDYMTAQQATALSAAACAWLLEGGPAPAGLLHPAGCILWTQPGVALVASTVYDGKRPINESMAYGPERARWLLGSLPAARWAAPPAPREEDDAGGEPALQAYLMNRAAAVKRIKAYNAAYHAWLSNSPDTAALKVPAESLKVDFAIAVIGSGPLELYFQRDKQGRLRLRHIVYYDYFSA